MSQPDKRNLLRYRERFPNTNLLSVEALDADAIKDDCLVVLDTNVMLNLYENTRTTFTSAAEIYRRLAAADRLCLLGHVAREFAQHRPAKVMAIRNHIRNSLIKFNLPSQMGPAPLFDTEANYKELRELEEQTLKAIEESVKHYRDEGYKLRQRLLKQVDSWGWNDPVTTLYREVFPEANQHDITVDQDTLRAEMDERRGLKLPPGLTDEDNEENPAGDLLVWKTLLDLAKTRKRNVLFICNERKPDWWVMDQARELYLPAFELINEFWRETEGKAFHMVDFPAFLAMYGAEAEAVSDAERQLEHQDALTIIDGDSRVWSNAIERVDRRRRVSMLTYDRLDEFTSYKIQEYFTTRFGPLTSFFNDRGSQFTCEFTYNVSGLLNYVQRVAVQVYDVRPIENFSDGKRFHKLLDDILFLGPALAEEAMEKRFDDLFFIVLTPGRGQAAVLSEAVKFKRGMFDSNISTLRQINLFLSIGFLAPQEHAQEPVYVSYHERAWH